MWRKIAWIGFAGLLLAIVAAMIDPILLVLAATLCFGWTSAMHRYWLAWHPGLAPACLFCGAVAILYVGMHYFFKWSYAGAPGGASSREARIWKWKWTICGAGAVVCSFLGITSLILTTHQLYWTWHSPDPLFASISHELLTPRSTANGFQKAADALAWDRASTQRSFYGNAGEFRQPPIEVFDAVWLDSPDEGDELSGVVLVPRHPLKMNAARVFVLRPNQKIAVHPYGDLAGVLRSLGAATNTGATPKNTLLP